MNIDFDSSSILHAVATGVGAPVIIWLGAVIKKSVNQVFNYSENTKEALSTHATMISDLSTETKKNKADSEISNGKLSSDMDRLRTDIKNAQYSFETKTENLQDGLKFVVSMKGIMEEMGGKLTRIDQDVQGLKITVATQADGAEAAKKLADGLKDILARSKK